MPIVMLLFRSKYLHVSVPGVCYQINDIGNIGLSSYIHYSYLSKFTL